MKVYYYSTEGLLWKSYYDLLTGMELLSESHKLSYLESEALCYSQCAHLRSLLLKPSQALRCIADCLV